MHMFPQLLSDRTETSKSGQAKSLKIELEEGRIELGAAGGEIYGVSPTSIGSAAAEDVRDPYSGFPWLPTRVVDILTVKPLIYIVQCISFGDNLVFRCPFASLCSLLLRLDYSLVFLIYHSP